MSGPSIDPQIAGVLDDSTSVGIVRARLASGDLVALPFDENKYGVSTSGGAGASYNAGSFPDNPDGSCSGFFVSLPNTTPASPASAVISFTIYGTYFGLRYSLTTAAPDASVQIDQVSYRLPLMRLVPDTQVAMTAALDMQRMVEIANDLPDRPEGHEVRLVFPFDPAGAAYSLALYGYLVERRRGYRSRLPAGSLVELGLLTTSQARIIAGTSPWRGLRKVIYYNSSASPVVVTITLSGNVIKTLTVPATDSAEWDLGDVIAVQRTSSSGTLSLFHAAATGAVVRATAIVGV